MGVKERKVKEKMARKQDILSAAEKLFIQNGYQKTTLEDIADSCELSKGTIYLYFKNKEQLFLSILERALVDFNTYLLEHIESTTNMRADERLSQFAGACLDYVTSLKPESKRILQEAHIYVMHQGISNGIIQRINRKFNLLMPEHLNSIIKKGIEDGTFRETDSYLVSEAFSLVIRGLMFAEVLWVVPTQKFESIFFQAIKCFIDGLYNNPNLLLFT